jgi:hypothetical protein
MKEMIKALMEVWKESIRAGNYEFADKIFPIIMQGFDSLPVTVIEKEVPIFIPQYPAQPYYYQKPWESPFIYDTHTTCDGISGGDWQTRFTTYNTC